MPQTKLILMNVALVIGLTILGVAVTMASNAIFGCRAVHQLNQICWGKLAIDSMYTGVAASVINRKVLKWHKTFPWFCVLGAVVGELIWETSLYHRFEVP